MHIFMHVYIHIFRHIYMFMYVHTCIYSYMYINAHPRTHTCLCGGQGVSEKENFYTSAYFMLMFMYIYTRICFHSLAFLCMVKTPQGMFDNTSPSHHHILPIQIKITMPLRFGVVTTPLEQRRDAPPHMPTQDIPDAE